ncbi:hypothetical protein, partial [Phascolarctobacterium succinatutens]|uniref:hypothetical protein n=1 Tax=Phascolarctobacterium succinatutens TaxID=626940 RepID=UPI0023F88124
MAVAYIFIPGPLSGPDFFHIRQIESLLQYTKIQHTQYHLYDKHYYCFQNFHLILFTIFFILSLASHLQQNKQCLSAYVGSNLAVPMVSETSGCYVYCFFVQHLMLYFAGANIIIKGEKT